MGDVLGLMSRPLPGWEERAKALARPENFIVSVCPKPSLLWALSQKERERLARKLRLVQRYACLMAAGMLKGCLKYERDELSVQEWMAHLLGEGADQSNYELLLVDAWEREGKEDGPDSAER